jgi:glycerol uptake facilitator-like aquaporin
MLKYLVEFLGTMLLAYVVLATGNWFAIGGALAIGCLLGAKVSGAAYNPAVAISYYAAGKITQGEVLPYIIAEVLGGLAAYQCYKMYVK